MAAKAPHPIAPHPIAGNLRRMANEAAELPGIRLVAEPVYRRRFVRERQGNTYLGVYPSFEAAMAAAPQVLPNTYDTAAAGELYRSRLHRLTVSDYPVLHWMSRLLAAGQRRVFDLGGHIGVSYYALRRYLDYPPDLHWLVHDVPSVVDAGRQWARDHDQWRQLAFSSEVAHADGRDVLIASGALQYLDYSLPELLSRLARAPAHVVVNLTPMHPELSYFTLQNLGTAICPYRVSAVPQFLEEMSALDYTVVDRWESFERHLRLPFAPRYSIDRYHGFYLKQKGR
ncbi:methyltransferase, TIGR04325 family [Lysobacter ciconiae]|uniref:Methyltransferase, TIGR04325 family n=1 Tax=Novilysobacter ciconiae TaxID=2781022 RepID=A0A7S6UEJ5_9GAMM|nr:TIGR04325 family methyltransferase [Lysobacter ciconiae]QOW18810.1 methyltransferase, TIGR04325 family [Lysobacter ciconiae]